MASWQMKTEPSQSDLTCSKERAVFNYIHPPKIHPHIFYIVQSSLNVNGKCNWQINYFSAKLC